MHLDPTVATSAAPLARRGVARRRLRVVHAGQRVVVAASLLATAAAWASIMGIARGTAEPWFLIVPVLLVISAGAAFGRRLWAIVLVRAGLWASAVCGAVITLVGREYPEAAPLLGIAGCAGLLFLGRFSRAFGGARPLLVALVVLAVSDAAIHGLIAAFVLLDGVGHELNVVLVCGFAAVANAVGLAFILRRGIAWPHIAGNAIVVVLVSLDLLDAPAAINVPMVGAALAQMGLAFAQRLPRAPAATRRKAELAMRVAIVALMASMAWAALA